MSSFFTAPGGQKKRKRSQTAELPKKRAATAAAKPGFTSKSKSKSQSKSTPKQGKSQSRRPNRDDEADDDDSISGSDSDTDLDRAAPSSGSDEEEDDDGDHAGETAAEKRLRLAERYLDNVRAEVDDTGFDAADLDRDLIAERLEEDAAETKGRVHRRVAADLALRHASRCLFRAGDSRPVTAVAACAPFLYTVSKDRCLVKWRAQPLPRDQFPQTTRKKPKKPPAPPRRQPEKVAVLKEASSKPTPKGKGKSKTKTKTKGKDQAPQRHTGDILCVAASQDGKFVVTGGADSRLIIYDAVSLRTLRVFTQHRDAVTGLAFRRGTNQLYSASRDRTVKVWSLDELAYVETLFGHQDQVVDIDALAQERCISVGARDRTARLWKVVEETQLVFRGGGGGDKKHKQKHLGTNDAIDPRSLAHEGSTERVAMLDEELFVTGGDNGGLALWSTQKKKPLFVLPLAHGLDPPLSPTEASAEVEIPDPAAVVPPPQPRWITALRALPYSDLILSGSWDGHVRVWRLSEDKKRIEAVGVLGGGGDDSSSLGYGDGHSATNGEANNDSSNEDEDMEEDVEAGQQQRKPKHQPNGVAPPSQQPPVIKGVVNDLAVFERGDRGKDGLCVIAAVGKEHRLGRWKLPVGKGARNGAVIFEVPRLDHDDGGALANGVGVAHNDPD